ncbi:hypothetical protein E2C01_026819 [Portunus trituberculatus]|uniref:Uncharacterized protein n=1 Tax=Portunus trituberculatus TaxID=210409 RepID=A0A5B7EJE9_PORTR|nr:hypothetical protein [Portunus trituberculatus]
MNGRWVGAAQLSIGFNTSQNSSGGMDVSQGVLRPVSILSLPLLLYVSALYVNKACQIAVHLYE